MGLLDKTIKTEVKKDNVSFVGGLSKDILYKNPNDEAHSMRFITSFNKKCWPSNDLFFNSRSQ